MSYIPRIIISKDDLEKKIDIIRAYFIKGVPKKETENQQRRRLAHIALDEASMREGFKIKGVRLIIIWPELSMECNEIRKLLHEYNIEFAVDD